ncbi:MAG: hypothetical protein KTR25_13730 [Myxococcales bacterium]|nr:hypothetical protein [Myxococcales bacterium]
MRAGLDQPAASLEAGQQGRRGFGLLPDWPDRCFEPLFSETSLSVSHG